MNENVGVVESNFHAFRVRDEVGRKISAIEFHVAGSGFLVDAAGDSAIAYAAGFLDTSQIAVTWRSSFRSHISNLVRRAPSTPGKSRREAHQALCLAISVRCPVS